MSAAAPPPAPLPGLRLPRPLILASTSRFRRELLARLGLPFTVASPAVDETPRPGEAPPATAVRLARAKAAAAAAAHPAALIIGSDQVACQGAARFDKPGTRERAIAQLERLSGGTVVFHTALCLLDSQSGRAQEALVPTTVGYRRLTRPEIEHYVDADDPLGCAGTIRSEGLGITLLEFIRGDDPTALVGLPLIALTTMLRSLAA